jgi:pyrroline-5-carboxylate reductase
MLPLAGLSRNVTFFGCGAMGGAMVSRWLACGLSPAKVSAIRKSGQAPAPGVATKKTSRGMPPADLLFIAIKPQQFAALCPAIRALVGERTVILSIMAGISLDALNRAFPEAHAVARLMPNLPVARGAGVIAQLGDGGAAKPAIDALLYELGHVQRVDDERSFELVTALSGCGPAFTYRFAAALAAAGERLGLSSSDAETLARLTVEGAAGTMATSDEPLGALAAAVASPGGMTQAGLDVLDADGALVQLLTDTLRAARDRGSELSALASD